jgi:hypothetical protein
MIEIVENMGHLNSIIPTSLNLNFSPVIICLNLTNYQTWKAKLICFKIA